MIEFLCGLFVGATMNAFWRNVRIERLELAAMMKDADDDFKVKELAHRIERESKRTGQLANRFNKKVSDK